MRAPILVSPDAIRTRFSGAMSQMYRLEVPQYGTLLEIVQQVNAACLDAAPAHREVQARLDVERHGAIRLGTAQELSTMRRVFGVMGMQAVGYYDLSVAGVPMHATAFRPITDEALRCNPFRVFTSLLRLDLIADQDLREEAQAILARRRIFSDRALQLLDRVDADGGLGEADADDFVAQVLETFRWHRRATGNAPTYQRLHAAHRLLADVVCFKGPHINHLTPRTLDIDAVQAQMPRHGIQAKDVVEGPPRRRHPILLRQTSFKALQERIAFGTGDAQGTHTARFGEIEQRGMALTPAGRQLYDTLLASVRSIGQAGSAGPDYAQRLAQAFHDFPDALPALRTQGLAFFRYRVADEAGFVLAARAGTGWDLERLLRDGLVEAEPITYEDFLPVSAAGIFQSNLGGAEQHSYAANGAKAAFEEALQGPVLDEIALYAATQSASIEALRARFALRA